jgi:hypothetical protein
LGRLNVASITKRKDDPKRFNMRLAPGVTATFNVVNKDGEDLGTVVLEDGAYLNLQSPQERIAFLVENDHISEEKGEEILENIPDYVKYEVSVETPKSGSKKGNGKAKTSKAKTEESDDDF